MPEIVGYIDVDSGTVFVGDPCYTHTQDAEHTFPSWYEYCDESFRPENKVAPGVVAPYDGKKGIGLEISTAWGDGSYPVSVTRDAENRITSVKVHFDWESE